ncbi:aquaporin-like protein [Xylaria sp. CBS 124048]|nr:aquaporin-like protein [Xylaria sp. CBS 124048]
MTLSPTQGHLVASTGEFVGTFWFLFFAYAGQLMVINQAAQASGSATGLGPSLTIYVALAWLDGFSLLVTVWAMYRISGGCFNPALIASICAGAVVKVLFPGNIASLNTKLASGVNIAQGLFAEMFFTSYLVFVVLILAAEKSRDTFIAPVGIGLALFVAEIPGVYFTGGSLNPARSFGCAVAAPYFIGYHWIYWVGPALGAMLASGYYRFVKLCHYEEANPGQDAAAPLEQERSTGRNMTHVDEV